nr:MAG TPA: hypothetical protein [Caudoviricetes sp.]
MHKAPHLQREARRLRRAFTHATVADTRRRDCITTLRAGTSYLPTPYRCRQFLFPSVIYRNIAAKPSGERHARQIDRTAANRLCPSMPHGEISSRAHAFSR